MPRSNRYILPGYIYHVTHRCHDRRFLLKIGLDRTEYRERLRLALHEYRISLFAYCITSNHTHLLLASRIKNDISRMMQKLEGDFAQYYNRKRSRRGAYWEDRFHATMIGEGSYFLNCMVYIHLNMVRAGVVEHPGEWRWCGHDELVGERTRYRLIDRERLRDLLGPALRDEFDAAYRREIADAIATRRLQRQPWWTESIAVGDEQFVRTVKDQTLHRRRLDTRQETPGVWVVRDAPCGYGTTAEPVEL
jgi:putative transposase